MKSDLNNPKNPRSTLTDHLDASIQRVRDDLEAVSFWAHAVSGFSQPIPAYEPDETAAGFQAVPFTATPKGKARKSRARH